MSVLLLRLAGPLQAWGTDSKFEIRTTETFPTKSGIIGMIASAMGRKRTDPVDDLAKLKIGIRVDDPGRVIKDFHTAKSEKTSYISTRYYLSDAVFTAAVESDNKELIDQIEESLKNPAFPLFLGRSSCVPDLPLVLYQSEDSLEDSLKICPWQASVHKQKRLKDFMEPNDTFYTAPIFLESSNICHGSKIRDVPKSFSPIKREYRFRAVIETSTDLSSPYYHTTESETPVLSKSETTAVKPADSRDYNVLEIDAFSIFQEEIPCS